MNKKIELYNKYHQNREDTRIGLFIALAENYLITRVLYPGSFVHITPSLIFPEVVYVDNFGNTEKFYSDLAVLAMIKKNKQYSEKSIITFHKSDYAKGFNEPEKSFDLVLSQYAGFISQACKKYLKKGGLLVTNNSHGDASMAKQDKDYRFVGVYNRKTDKKYSIIDKDLASYFIPKKKDALTSKAQLLKSQRGVGYTKTPSGYIFKKR